MKRALLACFFLIGFSCPPNCLVAEGPSSAPAVWDFDSLSPPANPEKLEPSILNIYSVLTKMLDAWNMHNIDGYMDAYWRSPNLVFVSDAQLSFGWQELNDTYKRNFSELETMGKAIPNRIKIRLIQPDLALALTSWTLMLPKSTRTVNGVDTVFVEKFEAGWKIISSHTTTTDL